MNKVTVILAVWNARATVAKCVESVLGQTGVEVELIVLDGASSDGTAELIRDRYAPRLAFFQSERDGGIYHAWNAGLARARGEWICFIGADDAFNAPDSLARLVAAATLPSGQLAEVVLSRGQLVDEQWNPKRVFGQSWNWAQLVYYVKLCHPGMLHHRGLMDRVGCFDTSYRICADYDFLMRAGPKTRAQFLDEVTVLVGDAGVSRARAGKAFLEHRVIQKKNNYIPSWRANQYWIMSHIKLWVRTIISRCNLISR